VADEREEDPVLPGEVERFTEPRVVAEVDYGAWPPGASFDAVSDLRTSTNLDRQGPNE
jgi:hypothetical protein